MKPLYGALIIITTYHSTVVFTPFAIAPAVLLLMVKLLRCFTFIQNHVLFSKPFSHKLWQDGQLYKWLCLFNSIINKLPVHDYPLHEHLLFPPKYKINVFNLADFHLKLHLVVVGMIYLQPKTTVIFLQVK